MKKILCRVFAIAIAVVLFSTPVTTHAATIDYVYENGTYKEIHYSPNDLLIINSDTTGAINNNVNGGAFYVPASGYLSCYVNFIMPCCCYLMLYDASTGNLITQYEYDNSQAIGASFPIFKSGNYRVIIKALYGTTAIVDWCAISYY